MPKLDPSLASKSADHSQLDEILNLRQTRSSINHRLKQLGAADDSFEQFITKAELADFIRKAREYRADANPANPFAMDTLRWLENAIRVDSE